MLSDFRDIEFRPLAVSPPWLLWLMLSSALALGGFLVWSLALPSRPPETAHRAVAVEGLSTFQEAAASMRSGRHAEAYGRFVGLAEYGDVDAARMALLMYRFGPSVFGSQWDATPEQISEWTQLSRAAEERDVALLRAQVTGQASVGTRSASRGPGH